MAIKIISKEVSIQDKRLTVTINIQLLNGTTVIATQSFSASVNEWNDNIKAIIKADLVKQIKEWKSKLASKQAAKQKLSTLETEIEKEV